MSAKDPSSSSRTTLRVPVSSASVSKNTAVHSRPPKEREEPSRERPRTGNANSGARADRASRHSNDFTQRDRTDPRRDRGPRDERPQNRGHNPRSHSEQHTPHGEQPSYGGIRTYRAPADLKGKAAPIKIIQPQEHHALRADSSPVPQKKLVPRRD